MKKNNIVIPYLKEGIFLTTLFVITFSLFLFNSCRERVQTKCKDCLIIHASLEEDEVSLEKLFHKIEIIPLETTDNSLIQSIKGYDYLNGKHYIFDQGQAILFCFDEEGNYLNRIAKKGQGPGEYKLIYDFALNPQKGLIHMLSPFKKILSYDFDGKFVKTYDLTDEKFNSIQKMEILDENSFVVWTSSKDNQDWIYIISQETGQIENSFLQNYYLYNTWSSSVFHTYNNDIYFSLHLFNIVYKVTREGLTEDYEWDFGNKTMDISRYDLITSMRNINKDSETVEQKLISGEIGYEFWRNYQNQDYYFALLRFNRKYSKHVFYNKKTGKSTFFHLTTEGIQLYPLYFTDDYMIGMLFYDHREKLLDCPLLDEANKQKLLSFKYDDNPYLVRYYFK